MKPKSLFPILAAAVLTLAGWAVPAAAEELLHGRVSFADGGGLIKGAADDDWSYATVNTLVLPNDTLWADQEGTVEIELPGGTFLRMADGSKAEFVSMSPELRVRGWTGSFYVQRVSRSSGQVAFETPAARIQIDENSQVRLDVVGEGSTTVSVRWGRALLTIPGDSVPVVISEGQRVYVDPGLLPSSVVPFDRTVEDAFDVWNRERAKLLAVGYSSVPAQISNNVIGVSDLNNYGEWVYIDSEPYWRPTVVVDFVPYRHGYWSYGPAYGYSWTGHYPFSYITTHYGRWTHHPTYGWCWGYRPGWSSAWVASVRYGSNFVWCPVGFDGYPVYYGGAHFSVGGIRFGLYSSSYCGVNDLFFGPTVVHGVHSNIFHGVSHNDIYIWNININTNRIGRDILPNTNLRVRDYSPRRVIRGPDIAGPRLESARTRIASLEASSPRASFDRAARSTSSSRSVRTAIASSNRSAEIRTARVRDTDLQHTREAVRRVLRQDQDPDTITGRGAGSGVRSSRVDIPDVASRGDRAGSDATRTNQRGSRSTFVPGADDSPSAGSSRVPATTRSTSPDSNRDPRSRATTVGPNNDDNGRSRAVRTGDAAASPRQTQVPDAGDRTPRTSTRVNNDASTRVPDRASTAPSTRSATPDRTPTPRIENRSATPDRTPAPRVENRSATPDRTPAPRVEPRQSAPSRTPAIERSAPVQRTPDRPSTSSPSRSRSESRVTVPQQGPSRQSYSRQTNPIPSAPRYSPPTRSAAPSYSPPPRSEQRSAPSISSPRSSSPSFSTRSSNSSSRSFSAPSGGSSRSVGSAPRSGGSSRSIESGRGGRGR